MLADDQRDSGSRLPLADHRLALLAECVGDCAHGLLDADGIIVDWRDNAAPTAHRASELQGRAFTDVFGAAGDALAAARAAGRYRAECMLVRQDGEAFPAHIAVQAIDAEDGQGPGYCVVLRDLTRPHQQQRQLEETRAQLFQCQKVEALGQLTSGIAHDFNNLLQGIVGSLDVIAMQLERGRIDNVERFIRHAAESARSASALTHRLLTLGQPHPPLDRDVDVNAVITSMSEIFSRTLGEHISLNLQLAARLMPVRCDPHQLESVLLNLAINARDAMPHGGKLTFATHDAPPGAMQPCRRMPGTDRHGVCLEVIDNGTGMDEATRRRAFEPFFTTKPVGRGTGLGLSMIRVFVEQSGRQIELDSQPGRGTTVRMLLPCCNRQPAAAARHRRAARRVAPVPERTILVVEDSTMVRELVAAILRDGGYRVLEAADGPEGLALLQSDVPIDLVISDVGLPGMKGPAMIDAAASRPGIKVLFISGYGQTPSAGQDNTRSDWLAKPFSMDSLLDSVAARFS
jgi:signal transduction histidine kinase